MMGRGEKSGQTGIIPIYFQNTRDPFLNKKSTGCMKCFEITWLMLPFGGIKCIHVRKDSRIGALLCCLLNFTLFDGGIYTRGQSKDDVTLLKILIAFSVVAH